MNPITSAAFAQEMEKISTPGILGRVWKHGLSRAATGAGAGAGVGALADPENRTRGALLGAATGAAAGTAAPLATTKGRTAARAGLGRWWRTQKHGFTGRGNAAVSPKATAAERATMRRAQQEGLTSVPGLYKALRRSPKRTMKEAWRATPTSGKVMLGGFAALDAANAADPKTREGLAEKGLGTLGGTSGYLLSGRMGFLPSMATAIAGSSAGSYLGKGIDRLRGYKPPAAAVSAVPTRRRVVLQAPALAQRAVGEVT